MLGDHELPLVGIALLEGQPFAVGPTAKDDRILSLVARPIHIGTKHNAVVHLDGPIPVDRHDAGRLDRDSIGRVDHCRLLTSSGVSSNELLPDPGLCGTASRGAASS